MTTDSTDPVHQAQHDLAAWHATHPDATLAEIEGAVEAQLTRVRAQLIEERTQEGAREGHPMCRRARWNHDGAAGHDHPAAGAARR